jgi:two-component sensor histidine kinase/tetratricopeptide (TPR) repeat protein
MRWSNFIRLPLALLFLFLMAITANGQSVSRAEADSLLRLLRADKADTNRVNQLIRLGEYQVYKPGEFKEDMDSARAYAGQAKSLSQQLSFISGHGRSLNLLGIISREAKQLEQSVIYHQQALQLYHKQEDWKVEAETHLLLAWARRNKGETEAARKEVRKAIGIYTKKNYSKGVGQAYLELGNSYDIWTEELKERISYYQQALTWFIKAKDTKQQADIHKDLGDLYQVQGSYAQALLELRKALTLYQSIRYPQLQGIYDLLGTVSSEMGDYQEGIKYGLLAVKTAEAVKDTTMQLCTIYNRVGVTYTNLKQYQKALLYYNKSLLVARKYNDQPSIIILSGNIGTILARLGQLEASVQWLLNMARLYPPRNTSDSTTLASRLLYNYTQMKQYAKAQTYCNQLLSLSKSLEMNDRGHYLIFEAVIPFFIVSKQYGQARKYLAKYEEFNAIIKSPGYASNAQMYWFKLDSMQGNYPSAIGHYQQYKMLRDSLVNEAKSRQIANLDVLYETEKKEQDLKLKEQSIKVLTKERQLQAKQSEQDRLLRNALFGGALLLLLLIGVIYNRYRLKQRSNRQLQAQQEQLQAQHQEIQQKNAHLSQLLTEKETMLSEQQLLLAEKERLLKEIHHRVKNNLQIVMSLLNSQAASLEDKAALSAIQESQHRVQAMALIHQKLYQAEGVARIPMQAYIEEVVAYLQDSYMFSSPIRFSLQIEDIELDVTQAVPLGLIINEALTNALKYAFPNERNGSVYLSLKRQAAYIYQLFIADDGVGLPVDFDPSRSRSLGMTLMHGFSAQLGGGLSITSPPGMSIELVFAEEQLNPVHVSDQYA